MIVSMQKVVCVEDNLAIGYKNAACVCEVEGKAQ